MFGFGATVFTPEKDIPDLSGKVILVTGGHSGLGEESVLQFAKHKPEKIYLAARSKERADEAIARIKKAVPSARVTFLPLDLTSFRSVKDAANTVNTSTSRLDILMNNAGIMGTPAATTEDGYEIQFGTNHMGHALLTKLLLPKLQATAKEPGSDVRIVTLSSAGHQWAPKGGIAFEELHSNMKSTSTIIRYGQSKLANILYSNELTSRYPDIRCMSIHPGAVNTGLKKGLAASYWWIKTPADVVGKVFMMTSAQGALNQLWASTSADAKSGKYYVPIAKENTGSAYVRDKELGTKLWDWTEKELETFLARKQ
ncbi:NAD(P)-binding protein [Acephala macrosclerotiorum]|nr:NAD(P)-binding protein [Acephala macrosclerotiorum]